MAYVLLVLCILLGYTIVHGKKSSKKRTLRPRYGHLSGRGIPGDPVNKHSHEGQRALAALAKVSKHRTDFKSLYDEHEINKEKYAKNDDKNNLDAFKLKKMKMGDSYKLEEPSGFKSVKKQLELNKDGFKSLMKHLDLKKLKFSLRGKNNNPNEVLTSSKLLTSKAVTGENTYEIKRNVDIDNQRSLQMNHPGYCWEQSDEASCNSLGDGNKCIAEVYDGQFQHCSDNICHEDHFSPSRCSQNSHCLNADDNDEYCQTTQVPCRDCPQCASVPVCSDMLLQCSSKMDDTTWLQTNVPNSLHPCNNEACSKDKDSTKCENNLYDYCCDEDLAENCHPSAEMKALRATDPCSPQGCTRFKEENYFMFDSFDWSTMTCPFNQDDVCRGECENYLANIFLELSFDVLMSGSSLMTESIDAGRNTINYRRKLLDDLKEDTVKRSIFGKKKSSSTKNHQRMDKNMKTKGDWPTEEVVEEPMSR